MDVALVDENDNIISRIDRWEAHQKGLLHRAFTLSIFFENKILLQHRKHPVFDFTYDTTISSHPYYEGDTLMQMEDAIAQTLHREWHIDQHQIKTPPLLQGKFTYQAKDPWSQYIEHEVCHVYTCEINQLTLPDAETAYGFTLLTKEEIKKRESFARLLAPWVKEMIKHGLL